MTTFTSMINTCMGLTGHRARLGLVFSLTFALNHPAFADAGLTTKAGNATDGAAASPQAPNRAPALEQPTTQPPQPPAKPALKLRLDEVDLRRAITFDAKDGGRKPDAAQSLPGLGGKPSKSWESSTPDVVPPSSNSPY